MKKLTTTFNYHHAVAISLVIIITIVLMGTISQWGFKTDDFGNLYHTSLINSWQDFCSLFFDKSIETLYYPSGSSIPPSSFFSGLYRPLSFIYYLPQYLLFGTHPYGYYAVTIIIHGCNAGLLYNFLTSFVPYGHAIIGTLLFGFHPSLHNWLGWISAQTYQTELFFFLLLLILLKRFFTTKQKYYCLFALICYALNLWLKEATIITPIWITLLVIAYRKKIMLYQNRTTSYTILFSFWGITLLYLLNRAIIMGITPTGAAGNLTFTLSWQSFIARQHERFFDLVSYVSDSIGLCWLPEHNQLLKGSCILIVLGCFTWLFWISKEKKMLITLGISTLMFSWPAILMHYQPRYLYLALPFTIAMIMISLKPLSNRIVLPCMIFIIIGNGYFLTTQLQARSHILHKITYAFRSLVHNPITHERSLYFVGLPHHWFAMSVAQAVWFLSNNNTHSIYHNDTVVEVAGVDNYRSNHHTDKQYLQVTPTHQGLLLSSQDITKQWIKLGKSSSREKSYTITFPDAIQKKNPVIITWDYYHDTFLIINKP